MRKYLAAGITAACIVAIITTLYAQPTTVISFGPAVTVLNTASTGAVTGSTFALPGTNANVLTWQITADGSALSASLQVSLDGTNWLTLTTCTTAGGCIYNAGVNAYVFVRVTQTSRTGGTVTTSQVNTDRAYSTQNGQSPIISGNLTVTGSYLALGTNPAQSGLIRIPHASTLMGRNSANTVDVSIINWGSSVANETIVGTSGVPIRMRTSMATPATLANGDWFVDCVGTSPSRVCSLKAQDGGSTRVIGTMTY